MSAWIESVIDSEADMAVEELILGAFEDVDFSNERVLVQVHMPHIKKYLPKVDPLRDLVYRWPGKLGPIAVGDLVICPPTPRHSGTFVGIITSLDASAHPYKGKVKNLRGKA